MDNINIHPHAKERMQERGVTKEEVVETILKGESFTVKFNRVGFRKNFNFYCKWRGKYYNNKQVEVIAVRDNEELVVITVIAKYF
jgi:hypothetical protein